MDYIDTLDEKDNAILNLIEYNARLSYQEIGERVGISRVAVKARMDKLEASGVISGYRTTIDRTKARKGELFLVDIETEPDAFHTICYDKIASNPVFIQVYTMTGAYRIHAVGFVSGEEQMKEVMKALYEETRGIKSMTINMVLNTIKRFDGGIEYEKAGKKLRRS